MGGQRIPVALLALVVTGCYTGEGSGRVVVERFDVEAFSEIVLSSGGRVTVVPGENAVSVSAEDDVLPSLHVAVDGTTLHLQREVDWIDGIRPTVPVEFRVAMPMLDAVRVSGSGRVAIRGVEFGTETTFAASGAGSIDAVAVACRGLVAEVDGAGEIFVTGINASTFRGVVGGSGRITAQGSAEEVDVAVGGSGLYRGSDLRGSSTRVEVGGVGQAFVWAVERLEAGVGGEGRVVYRGDPSIEERVRQDDRVVAMESPAGEGGG